MQILIIVSIYGTASSHTGCSFSRAASVATVNQQLRGVFKVAHGSSVLLKGWPQMKTGSLSQLLWIVSLSWSSPYPVMCLASLRPPLTSPSQSFSRSKAAEKAVLRQTNYHRGQIKSFWGQHPACKPCVWHPFFKSLPGNNSAIWSWIWYSHQLSVICNFNLPLFSPWK